MAIEIFSTKTGRKYDSLAEATKAEEMFDKKLAEEKAKKEALVANRKTRADEVEKAFKEAEEAYKKANNLLADFCKDYGAYHKTYKEGEKVPSLFDWFINWF